MEQIDKILDFWFEGVDHDTDMDLGSPANKRWFGKNDDNDKFIVDNFSSDLTKARKGKYDAWRETARGTLALVILLDQFSRNIYRGSAKAFDTDLQALEYCLMAIKKEFDLELNYFERAFLYMPMMHSENIKIQEMSVQYFEKQLALAEKSCKSVKYAKSQLDYAIRHYDVIKRFQRFPHRNAILKRRSTSTELEFLKQPGSSF